MPSPATEVDAGGRAVRVSNPDRVIYEESAHGPAVTKLEVVEYYLAVADGVMRALRDRPTALERWPKGVREGMRLAARTQDRDADAFYQKRMMKGAPEYVEPVQVTFPSGRTAEEMCPTEVAVVAWAAQMGALTFHPWPCRRTDVDHPDELRIDLDPQPGTDFADAAVWPGRDEVDKRVALVCGTKQLGPIARTSQIVNCGDRCSRKAGIPGPPG